MRADQTTLQRANDWINADIDLNSKADIKAMMDAEDQTALVDAFYQDLEFGTGGLRGIMGVGSNRMNVYTVGKATQGLCNYLLKQFPGQQVAMAISYDSRINSKVFAQRVADICTANGIKVFFSDRVRPTPMLSYAIRYYGCKSGVMITASHNPKEYNGYKAYWEDGAQVVAPHDKAIIGEVNAITDFSQVKTMGNPALQHSMDEDFDRAYLGELLALRYDVDAIKRESGISIVFSAIHGTTGEMVPKALQLCGFENVHVVEEQNEPNGNFPTVHSPNPEEPAALALAIELAKKKNAHLVMACDPDGDRVGAAALGRSGEYELLNGNQTAALLTWYILRSLKEHNRLMGNEFVVSTIVTSELILKIAESFGVKAYETLTGFKYIASLIREKEGVEKFVGGGEESYGYMPADFVRDKDAIASCTMLAEVAAWAKDRDMSLFGLLDRIYLENGLYREHLISVTKKGKKGADEIKAMMQAFRDNMPERIEGFKVVKVVDVKSGIVKDILSGAESKLNLESSNVLQFYLEDGSKVSARPSGTEPKIKFYISVNERVASVEEIPVVWERLGQKIKVLSRFLESS
jgi:phosphoglucomutase